MASDANSILAISAWAPAKNSCFLFETKIGGVRKLHTSEKKIAGSVRNGYRC